MQKNMKTHSVDPEKNASQTDGYRTLLQKDGGSIMFFRNLRIKFS